MQHTSGAGEPLWKAELASPVFSPITCNRLEHVLIGTQAGHLHCLEAGSGAERWRQHIGCTDASKEARRTGISTAAAPAVSSHRAWEHFGSAGESAPVQQNHINAAAEDRLMEINPTSVRDVSGPHADSGQQFDMESKSIEQLCKSCSLTWSCTNSGDVLVSRYEVDQQSTAADARIGSEIFSSPVAFDDLAVFGCRDEYLYCVRLE